MILVFACSIFLSDEAIRKVAFAFFFFALVIPASAWGVSAPALCFPIPALEILASACFKAGFGRLQATFGRVQAISCRLQALLGKAQATIKSFQAVNWKPVGTSGWAQAIIRRVQAVIGSSQASSGMAPSGAYQGRSIHGQARFSF